MNGIFEGRVCDRGNARCGVDAPMFCDAATPTGMETAKTGVLQ
jgi:hypothetical protein